MKKYAVLFMILSGCAAIEKSSEIDVNKGFPHNEIQRIAVIEFETPLEDKENPRYKSKSAVAPDAGTILADMMARELTKWGRYAVLDRKALEEELGSLREEDILHTENFLKLGKSSGVDAVVKGRVGDFGISYRSLPSGLVLSLVTSVSFTARCIDVTTNETLWTVNIKGTSRQDNERVLASKLVTQAIKTLKTKLIK